MRTIILLALAASTAWAAPKLRADQAAGTAEQVEAGKAAYAMCAGCHGTEGEGRVGTAPRLNSSSYLAVVSNEFLVKTITEGRAGTNMIPFGAAMKPEQVQELVAYIRSWQDRDGVELDESALTGDLDNGKRVFDDICARCHGRSGAGYSEAGSGTGIGRTGFLGQATDGMLRAIIQQGKDNTAMRPFDKGSPVAVANLTPEEIDSVIKYLRTNAW